MGSREVDRAVGTQTEICDWLYRRPAASANNEPRIRATLVPRFDAPFVGEALGLVEVVDAPELVAFVPFNATARFSNAVKLRAEVCTGLTAKTMPAPQ